MNRIVITILSTVVCVLCIKAQNKTTLVQRINEIKTQNDIYYWNQATFPHEDTAKVVAINRLLIGINVDRSETDEVSFEQVKPHAKCINIDRGNLKQCFVYIKKTDAAAIKGNKSLASSVSELVVGVPISTTVATSPVQRPFVPDAFVQRIMETKNFVNVYKLLKSLQAQGQIHQFGKLKDVEDYSSLSLILFDMQSQEIVTILSPITGSGNRTNVINGTEDALDNYPTNMTAVIWYIKK